jgi:hypothetical protein
MGIDSTSHGFARFLFDFNEAGKYAPGELDFTLLAGNFKPAAHRKIFRVGYLLN